MRRMKRLLVYFFILLAGLILSGLILIYGFYEKTVATAEERFLVLDFNSAGVLYGKIQYYAEHPFAKALPFLDRQRDDIKARREEILYRKGEFKTLAARAMKEDKLSPERRFIAANASYRMLERESDRKAFLEAIDMVISSYASILESDPKHFNAAFNYEYLLRLRESVKKEKKQNRSRGSSTPGTGQEVPSNTFGQEGADSGEAIAPGKIKIHIPGQPAQTEGENENREGTDAGKGKVKRGPG